MESSIMSVANGFNLKCTKAKVFRDKFGYVCATTKGSVRIQRPRAAYRIPQSNAYNALNAAISGILFQHEVKECLHDNGFAIDRFLISSQDVPYFRVDDDIYVACFAHSGSNITFTDSDAFLGVIAHVARMHHVLYKSNIGAAHPKKVKAGDDAAKSLAGLTLLRKKLLKAGKFSEFDMLFLRSYEKLAAHVVTIEDSNTRYICHNLLKEENIYIHDGEIILTNFNEAAPMHYLYDLAYVVKRYIKAMPKDIIPLNKILTTYIANCPNIEFDDALFRRILLYPDKFIKISNDYYSKKRSFAPNTYISRIGECLRTGETLAKL